MLNWDDYRYVLAIAKAGNLVGAGKALNVTLTTVMRRLEKIEDRTDAPLFTKTREGYLPTKTGLHIVRAAERIADSVSEAEHGLRKIDNSLTGVIRLSASEVAAPFFLARHVPDMQLTHPGLQFEIISSDRSPSVSDREIDIALWPKRPTDPDLFGRKIATIQWAVYGADKVSENAADPNFAAGTATTSDDSLSVGLTGSPAAKFLMAEQQSKIGEREISISSNSLIVNAALAASGEAMAFLPCLLGSRWPGLKRLSEPFDHEVGELWIVCHKDLRNTAKTRFVFDGLINAARNDKALVT